MKNEVKQSIKKKKRKIRNKKIFEETKDIIFLLLGAFFISLSINMFLLPYKMTTGGASGIATILYYISNIPMGITILAINLPLFLISIIKLGKKFTVKTIISTVILSVFLEVFKYEKIVESTQIDLLMSCIFGGILSGIGLSFTFKGGASSGGSDLLANIIYKLTSIQSLSQILLVIEVVIIGSIILVFKDINIGLYSIIALVISTKVIDIIFEGIYNIKVATIITSNPDEIINRVLNDLKRGATITNTIGAHSNRPNTTITCIITRAQIAALKKIIKECDKSAVMYLTTANEAIGRGFKSIN